MSNRGGINFFDLSPIPKNNLVNLDDKMSEVKDNLKHEREALKEYAKLTHDSPEHEKKPITKWSIESSDNAKLTPDSPDYGKKISQTTHNIENLRAELADMREI